MTTTETEWRAEPQDDGLWQVNKHWTGSDRKRYSTIIAQDLNKHIAKDLVATLAKAALCEELADWIEAQVPRIEGAGEAREWTGYEGICDEGWELLRRAGRAPG